MENKPCAFIQTECTKWLFPWYSLILGEHIVITVKAWCLNRTTLTNVKWLVGFKCPFKLIMKVEKIFLSKP